MSKIWRALLVSIVAASTAAFLWGAVSKRRRRAVQLGSERTGADLEAKRTRVDEIEALNAEERELMLEELSGQV